MGHIEYQMPKFHQQNSDSPCLECVFCYFFTMYLFLVAVGLGGCVGAFSSCGERGLLLVAGCRVLIVVASLIVEPEL